MYIEYTHEGDDLEIALVFDRKGRRTVFANLHHDKHTRWVERIKHEDEDGPGELWVHGNHLPEAVESVVREFCGARMLEQLDIVPSAMTRSQIAGMKKAAHAADPPKRPGRYGNLGNGISPVQTDWC